MRLSLAFVVVMLAGCSSFNFPYNSIGKDKPYPGTLAVVAAHDDPATKKLAENLTTDLQKRSKFRVMSQEYVARHLGRYPVDIAIHAQKDIKDDDKNPVWFLSSEKRKIDAIHARLKVQYVYLVWIREIDRISGQTSEDDVYPGGNLIKYPGGIVIGSTYSVAGSTKSPLALFRPDDYYILDALKIAASDITDDFVKATNSAK